MRLTRSTRPVPFIGRPSAPRAAELIRAWGGPARGRPSALRAAELIRAWGGPARGRPSALRAAALIRAWDGPAHSCEQHEVVAVDELRLVDVAQHRFDFRRRPAHDARRLLRTVIDEAARDFASVGADAADDLAAAEIAADRDDADRQQALAVAHQRVHGAAIQREPPGETHVIGKPLLARRERAPFGSE